MLIKKYSATTETDAMVQVKEDLGSQAVIMNIKHIKPRGVYRLFRKPVVEVTAALEEQGTKKVVTPSTTNASFLSAFDMEMDKNPSGFEKKENSTTIESKLETLQTLLEEEFKNREKEKKTLGTTEVEENSIYDNPYMKLIEEQLLSNEVTKEHIAIIFDEVASLITKDSTIDQVLAHIYQKIVLKLGQVKQFEHEFGKTKYIFFIGPTGVGKTTTIAKIASNLKLEKKLEIGLVTLDTYRIAAVEQLRTYANILGIPLKVVYGKEELEAIPKEYQGLDVVLIDTAGRSHRNEEQVNDIKEMIAEIDDDMKEVYLVVSATTKYKDLLKIIKCYQSISDFDFIFTKLDETESYGNILNVRMETGGNLSYTTWGQNVPDDLGKVDPQFIAKKLLGGNV